VIFYMKQGGRTSPFLSSARPVRENMPPLSRHDRVEVPASSQIGSFSFSTPSPSKRHFPVREDLIAPPEEEVFLSPRLRGRARSPPSFPKRREALPLASLLALAEVTFLYNKSLSSHLP